MSKPFDLAAEVRRLSDRAEISDLVLRYFRGVNTTDPSAPSAAVPDPGGVPPGQTPIATSARISPSCTTRRSTS